MDDGGYDHKRGVYYDAAADDVDDTSGNGTDDAGNDAILDLLLTLMPLVMTMRMRFGDDDNNYEHDNDDDDL